MEELTRLYQIAVEYFSSSGGVGHSDAEKSTGYLKKLQELLSQHDDDRHNEQRP